MTETMAGGSKLLRKQGGIIFEESFLTLFTKFSLFLGAESGDVWFGDINKI